MQLFRAMKEAADGLPEIGRSARKLGIRTGDHSPWDVAAILPTDIVGPGGGGLSVAPGDPVRLPRHRRPSSLGGTGADPVWMIDSSQLPAALAVRLDSPSHGLIEPTNPLPLADYEAVLAATRVQWTLYAR